MTNGVSVIIPTFNRSGLIARTIRSVLAATSPGDEILVIDDGSTDDTPEVVRPFCGGANETDTGVAIRYVRIENCGPGAARNVGIRLAGCPFVTFLDSDDEWLPDKLKLQRKVMENFPELVFCFSNICSKRPSGKTTHDILSIWRLDPRVGSADAPTHLSEVLGSGVPFSSIAGLPQDRADFNVHIGDMYPAEMEVHYVSSITVMVRKGLAGSVFRYAEDIRLMEDWECFALLAKVGPAAYLDCELAVQTLHTGVRLTDADELKQATTRITLLRRIWGADERFLAAHSARYQSLLKAQLVRRARLLIGSVRLTEAKEDLKASGGPMAYRMVASLPPALVSTMLRAKRTVQGLFK